MTLTLECPWCDGHVALHDEDDVLACDACGVVAHLASRPARGARRSRLTPVRCPDADGRDRGRRHRRGRPPARRPGPDLGRRGQPVRPARRRAAPGHADRPAQGRARAGRPGRRPPRSPTRRRPLALRLRPDLGPGHPPGDPRRPAGRRRGRPRPPAGVDGADPRRRGPGSVRRCPRRPCSCRACPTSPWACPAARSWPTRIAAALAEPPEPLPGAVLLERHGAVAVGADIDQALDRLELVEVLCRTWRDALLIRAARATGGMV